MTSVSHISATQSRASLWCAAIFVLLVCLPIRFWIGPVQMTGLRLFLVLAAPVLITLWLCNPTLRRDPSTWAFAGAVLWAGIAISQTSPGHLIENTGSLGLETFFAYLLGRLCIRTEQALVRTTLFAALILTLTLPLTIYESQTGTPLLVAALRAAPLITSVEVISIDPRMGLERAQSLFAHPIHFGLFAVSGFAIILSGLRPHLRLSFRVTLAFILVASTFLALSSGPLLALVVQIGLLLWAFTSGTSRRSWLTLAILLGFAYIAVDLASDRTPIRVFMSYATFSAHNAFWRGLIFEWGVLNVMAHPIFGLGFNDWVRPSFMISGSIDNYWLVLAMRYGLPGFFLFLAGFALAIRASLLAPSTPLRRAWTISILSLIVALCTVHVWTAIHAYIFFLLGSGQFQSGAPTPKPATLTSNKPVFTRPTPTPTYTRTEALS